MQFFCVLPREIMRADNSGLQQADDERAGSGERVEHMHTGVTDTSTEMLDREVVDRPEDEINDLDRSVDYSEGIGLFREGFLEEMLIQLGDDPLLAFRVINPGSPSSH